MRTIVMLHASSARIAARMVPVPGRSGERAWIERVVRRSLVKGEEFAHRTKRASIRLVHISLPKESDAFRRAVRNGDAVFEIDHDIPSSEWRGIETPRSDGGRTSFGDVVDWLLSLNEHDPGMLAKLQRISLVQAADKAHRWHVLMEQERMAAFGRLLLQSVSYTRSPSLVIMDEAYRYFRGKGIPRVAESHRFIGRAGDPQATNSAVQPLEPSTVERFMDAGDGRSWYRLMNPAALDEESSRMGHCVGQGGYDARVLSGAAWILSLRDVDGCSSCTVEWIPEGHALVQIKGPCNRGVPEECMEDVLNLIRKLLPLELPARDLAANRLRVVRGEGTGNTLSVERAPPDIETSAPTSDDVGLLSAFILDLGSLPLRSSPSATCIGRARTVLTDVGNGPFTGIQC